MQRDIGFLIFPDFQLLDLAGPLAAFQMAGYDLDATPYRLRVLSATGGLIRSSVGVTVQSEPLGDPPRDTLVVVGGAGCRPAERVAPLLAFVAPRRRRSRRVASVCTGAFILAGAGLLDGRAATTHWRHAAAAATPVSARARRRRPHLRQGRGDLDLGGHHRRDRPGAGADRGRTWGARSPAPRRASWWSTIAGRAGSRSSPNCWRWSRRRTASAGRSSFARAHLHEALPVERLADAACLSPRQFGRAFLAETGQTPAKAVERLRAEAARLRLESGPGADRADRAGVGFADPERMRRAFLRVFGQPPQALRRATRAVAAAAG